MSRHLSNAQNERDGRQNTGPWYVGDEQCQTDQECLNERDADDSLSAGTNRRGGKPGKGFTSAAADDALENRSTPARARLAVGHHDAGYDEQR